MPRWVLQSIGVFPGSNEVAPVPVYAVFVVLYLGLVVLAWRAARGRTRAALVLIMGVSAVLPLLLTVLTWDNLGLAWQGRYGLPYAMGLFLIAGQSLDRRPPKWAALSSPSALLLSWGLGGRLRDRPDRGARPHRGGLRLPVLDGAPGLGHSPAHRGRLRADRRRRPGVR